MQPENPSSASIKQGEVGLIKSGSEFFDLLEQLIHQAQQYIHLQTYIFAEDETGLRIAKALMQAALRKVQVYLIVDSYASQELSNQFITKLTGAGIHFRWFKSIFKSKYFYLGRRLHHKVFVSDDKHGLVGGINISDHYNNTIQATAWLDYAIYVRGIVTQELRSVCEQRTVLRQGFFKRKKAPAMTKVRHASLGSDSVAVCVNDWVRQKKQITDVYLRMLRGAESHITIMSPYFIPGSVIMRALKQAAKRGIKIQLILAGISDVRLAKYAERYIYRSLFNKNIAIYEYKRKVLHGKISVCDDNWVTGGSYNVNNISAYASIELNLEIKDKHFASHVSRELLTVIKNDCTLITEAKYRSTNFFVRILQHGAYDIFRLLFYLFTFYFKQHRE